MDKKKLRVAITHGDTNGVGYELIFKTFAEEAMLDICTPVVYGSAKVAAYHRKMLGIAGNCHIISSAEAAEEGRLNLVNCFDEEVKVELGRPTPESGQAALMALERAVADCRNGLVDVLVTAPICKAAIQGPDFAFSGHTEYLADRLETTVAPLMILCNSTMRVALATAHLPLSAVPAAITPELLDGKIRQLYEALRRDFRLSAPRIAVLGLNPHNGDDGLMYFTADGERGKRRHRTRRGPARRRGHSLLRSVPCRRLFRLGGLHAFRRGAGYVSRPGAGAL